MVRNLSSGEGNAPMFKLFGLAAALAFTGAAMGQYTAGVALIDPGLRGTVQYDGWIGLTAANYPGYGSFPGNAPWPGPIGSNRTPGNVFHSGEPGDAVLARISGGAGGGPFPQTAAIYFGGFSSFPNTFGGILGVTDSTPVPGLKNVVFQVQIGEALTHDFYDGQLPVLSFNGGTQAISPTRTLLLEQYFAGTVQMPTGLENLHNNTYLLQWDLTSIAEPITDFTISFAGVQHAQVYGMALHQSDVYRPVGPPATTGAGPKLSPVGVKSSRR
jgi:hypothetical protein